MLKIAEIILVAVWILTNTSVLWAFDVIEPSEGQKFELGSVIRVLIRPQTGEKIISVGVGFDEIPYNSNLGAFVREFPILKEANPGERVLKIEALSETKDILEATRKMYITLPSTVMLTGIQVERTRLYLTKVPEGTKGARFYETKRLRVKGQYSDGVERDASNSATGTTYSTSDEKIATVDSNGLVTAVAPGTTKITVKNGDKQLVIDVAVDQDK